MRMYSQKDLEAASSDQHVKVPCLGVSVSEPQQLLVRMTDVGAGLKLL